MKEFQLLLCAKRSTRDGNGRSSLFEGHADVKQGEAYEGYSLTVLALHLVTSAQAAEKPSQSFLKKAIQGNCAEVPMGSWRNRTVRATM
jgi:hypothetical protein